MNKDLTGAKLVLCNYLDGAVADLENNNIDEQAYTFIKDCIEALKILGDYSYKNYLERFNKAIKKRGKENEWFCI